MRTMNCVRHFALGALASAVFTIAAAAQAPSPVLNTLEVQKLVLSAVPADQARVAAHFAAMAAEHEAEASRHRAMAQGAVGNPSRQLSTGMNVHCTRLADLDTQAAATLRELAAHHAKLAAGKPSTAPPHAARYQGGEGARVPTDKELTALARTAKTAADHRALQEYFLTAAKRHTAEADEHRTMAQTYRGTRLAAAAVNCDRLVMLARDSAKEATAAATMHGDLAGIAE
jgi:hypothetical protein